jgi:hypothetical protein
MRKNIDREIIKLLDKKKKYLSEIAEYKDTIKDQSNDSKELWEALCISKKQDGDENISKQENEKLNDVKKHYKSFFEDEDGNVDESNITGSLNDALNSIKEDKLALIKTVNELNKKANNINKQINEKIPKSSLSDDSTEKDKLSSIPEDSAEEEPKHKKIKSSLSDDSAEKEIMEKEKKSSLVDDYADTSLEMLDIIDD